MFRKLLGYFLAAAGFLGYGYFRYYNGIIIPYPTLWLIASFLIGVIGLYCIYSSKSKRISKQEKYEKEKFDALKKSGEKIPLTPENCEIIENSYYEEELNENMSRAQQIDADFDPNRNHKQKFIEQSAIIYYYNSGDKKIKMVSQAFLLSTEMLAYYLENRSVALYVNRFDKTNYAFDLTPLKHRISEAQPQRTN